MTTLRVLIIAVMAAGGDGGRHVMHHTAADCPVGGPGIGLRKTQRGPNPMISLIGCFADPPVVKTVARKPAIPRSVA